MKILIIKIGALGDVVRTSFIAQALRDKYKKFNPRIFWLTDKKAKPLFINNLYIEKVIIDSEFNRENLKKESFDLIINLEEDRIYSELISYFKCKKLGFFLMDNKIVPSQTAKEWYDMSLLGDKTIIDSELGKISKNDYLKRTCKKTHRQLMSEVVEIKNWKKYEPFLRLSNYQIKKAEEFKKRYNIGNEIVLGLVLGGADRWPKSLPIDLSAKLIDKIYKKFKCKIILFGGSNEVERNKEIMSLSNSPVIDAGTGNDLIDFPALISVCNYVIATDSLGLHIALALKKKNICLIGPTPKNEKETFGHGKIILAKSDCSECMQKDCKSMEKISLEEVIKALEELSKVSLAIVITSYKEPKIEMAIESILNQKIDHPFHIIVSAPDKETQDVVRKYSEKYKKISLFKDPGKGKSLALNLLLPTINEGILIFTDGDVYLDDNAINEIIKLFNDSSIGCVAGRPVPEESRETKYGYWANFLFEHAHKMRKQAFKENRFLECSGYLFAFRNNVINSFPLDTAEDTIVPYMFWEKGYKIAYAEKAKVFVKNVNNLEEWLKQKVRTSLAHENLGDYVDIDITPRSKTFYNETKGALNLFSYPANLKEFLWGVNLLFARLFMWSYVIFNSKVLQKRHSDSWERVESTK
ncbi:MAG: glycosyltransferase [Nanoarchaeota archaeon]